MINQDPRLRRGYQIAKEITRKHSKTFYFASRFLSGDKRLATYAVYAICRASDDAVDAAGRASAPLNLAKAELDIRMAYDETPLSDPLLLAFRDTVTRYDIPKEYFDTLLEGVSMDLRKRRYRNFAELHEYCYKVAGVIGLIMLRIFGCEGAEAERYAVDLGIAMQLTNILRDVREDEERGRIYIPQDELTRYDVSEDQIAQRVQSDNWSSLLKFQIGRAQTYYESSVQGIKLITGLGSRFVVYAMKEIYGGILGAIERNDYDVFSQRAHVKGREKAVMALKILLQRPYV